MRRLFVILIGIYTNSLLGQIVIIKDSLLNTIIENATLHFGNTGLISNQNGIVDISEFNKNDIIEISHISYYSKKLAKEKINNIIYLTQKSNILPEITLAEEIKIPLSKKYSIFTRC